MAYLRFVHMPFLFQLQLTGFSVFWMFVSILLGLGYAFLLYRRNKEIPSSVKKLLFALRSITVALIAFLLFAPFIKLSNKTIEKPLIIILQDNSVSLSISKPSNFNLAQYNEQLKRLVANLSELYEVKTFTFGNSVQEGLNTTYSDKVTDISSAFKLINDRYINRNLGAVILASDGIYNRGGSPLYDAQNAKAPVYTIALGDTIPKKDLLVSNVNYNNIVYLGNEFQIEVAVDGYQSSGTNSRVTVSGKGGTVFSKPISIKGDEYRLTIPVTLSAREKGIQRFTVTVAPVAGELSTQNNTQTFFVEVLDGRQKVFILANSPHPDITALKQSIELNKNYEVKVGYAEAFSREDLDKSNLLILHQVPSARLSAQLLKQLIEKKSTWFILGAQTNFSAFSASQNVLNITAQGSLQEATAIVNTEFYDFVLSEPSKAKLQNFAPLLVPFGNYAVKSQSSLLLQQKIGRVNTDKPLLIFGTEGNTKTAILTGEGIWRWRLEDFKENESHQAIDELVSKVVQYLSSKDDRRKFRVYASKNAYDESENIILNGELYNDSYELVNTPEVAVTIAGAQGRAYPFIFSRTANSYVLNAGVLPPGEYSFSARTSLGNKKYSSTGRFVISQQQAEYRQTMANHQLLFSLAKQQSGEMVYPGQIASLVDKVKKNELVKAVSFENRRFEELINLRALFFLILALLSVEWFSRKRNGEL